jgi:hypothetical protein
MHIERGVMVPARSDLLSLTITPLAEELKIAGPIELRLWLASDAPDADINAKRIERYPPTTDQPVSAIGRFSGWRL